MITSMSFYMVDSQAPHGDIHYHVLRLAEKIYQRKQRATLVFPTEEEEKACDDKLWTYKQLSFIPHGCAVTDNDPEEHPLWLSTHVKNLNSSDTIIFIDRPPVTLKNLEFSTVVGIFPLEKKADFLPLFQEYSHLPCAFWMYTDTGWQKGDSFSL